MVRYTHKIRAGIPEQGEDRQIGEKSMKRSFIFLLVMVSLLCAAACALADDLTYTLLEDGSGYEVAACGASVTEVVIPAEYEGKPVVSIAGEAFLNCGDLAAFRTEEGQKTFYAVDGVLFTDQPVKTLVRFPNAYPRRYYQAPADTKAVAPWAFAGVRVMNYLHFQEGVESFGDHMLDSVACAPDIYVPDSLKSIGEDLLLNQQGSVAFYANVDSVFCRYAWNNNIPCGGISPWEAKKQTVELAEPDLTDAEDLPKPKRTAAVSAGNYRYQDELKIICDFSGVQNREDTELRLDLTREWKEITPDGKGNVADGLDPRTGLYGIGFTGEETVLRGYDRKGKLTGTRVVNGDFVFSLPDAYTIGVTGGKDTVLTLLPYQPVVTASTGFLPLDIEQFHYLSEDNRIQYYVVPHSYAAVSYDYPHYVNTFTSSFMDVSGNRAEDSSHFAVKCISFGDPYLLDKAGLIALSFDYLDVLYEDQDLTVTAASRFHLDEKFGKQLQGVLDSLKTVMRGVYYPAEKEINHITVCANGEYPTSYESRITLDDELAVYTNENVVSFAHEMTHAVDQAFELNLPSTWMEGRAEYISRKVCDAMGVSCWEYDQACDWSFLSEEYRSDFFSYYTEHANNETYYTVGYYFFKYLCDTYGENVSAKIMQNLFDAAEELPVYEWKLPNDVFKKCVTDATDPEVFQNFVRDVVERK